MHKALICDNDLFILNTISNALRMLGISDLQLCSQRQTALEISTAYHPDIIFLEAAQPINGIDLAEAIRKSSSALSILLLENSDEQLVKQAIARQIDSFLAKTVMEKDPASVVRISIANARLAAELRNRLEKAERSLAERKIIERAKGIMMLKEKLSEEEAYRRMRNQSMSQRTSMVKHAEKILEVYL